MITNGASASLTLPPFESYAGQRIVFAHSLDTNLNGDVPADLTFAFALVNSNGTLSFACDDHVLDTVTWSGSSSGRSRSLRPESTDPVLNDADAAWCFSAFPYNDIGDSGTPGATNEECP